MRLEGKTAFVTGGSHGIGREIAEKFAREGADVAFNYGHDEAGADATKAAIAATGRRALGVRADLRDLAALREMVASAVRTFGRLDILVNNAGVEHKADFWDVTEDDYDRVLDVNLKGLFFTTQAFVRHLRDTSRPGKVINISSIHEDLPFPGFASYCASKGGVRMLTRNLAVELGPLGITVNAIAPGAIETPINTVLLNNPNLLKTLIDHIPLGRLGKPKDVAGLALYLASADADYVNGSTYYIDGGLTVSYHEQ
ncbi:SDR family NAD(P)-dependent oxidoreductase [Fimbriiglobus ruber]|uniref:Glucose-1-dehydrogenase n=1 Tax=Fimbriiglobus ruber TaxID=1908690 RepID=A0A225E0S3_9BACT|nr:glucose 1-dehydrogenase [Fimbriiglobus ruber]OWK46783.1 glucose-1-dehydrogenase [Fimbriiglobus ruber]